MRVFSTIVVASLFTTVSFCQVGVNTTSPTETLDVNGTVVVRELATNSTTTTKLTGTTSTGVLGDIIVGNNLELNSGVLSATRGAAPMYLPTIVEDNFYNETKNNYDLDLGGANADKTLFILRDNDTSNPNPPATVNITGLAGGTDGRMVILKADTQNFNIRIVNLSNSSAAGNRFEFANSSGSLTNTNGYGAVMLIYVASKGQWVMINREIL